MGNKKNPNYTKKAYIIGEDESKVYIALRSDKVRSIAAAALVKDLDAEYGEKIKTSTKALRDEFNAAVKAATEDLRKNFTENFKAATESMREELAEKTKAARASVKVTELSTGKLAMLDGSKKISLLAVPDETEAPATEPADPAVLIADEETAPEGDVGF